MNKTVSISEVKQMLEDKGVRPSFQRMSILKYLIEKKNHPSVDVIYKELSAENPTLSRTTVYNSLNALHEKGLVDSITISETEVRYDYKIEPHAHFKCLKCGKIYDVEIDSDLLKIKSVKGHKVTETQFFMKGICKFCK